MHLLNVKTNKLEEYFDHSIPRYAILSHTWDADEVLYSQVCGAAGYKPGSSAKIDGCCAQAVRDGLHYVWIDTICIDKSSSAELWEAINSMFAWYRDAAGCYVFLADVPDEEEKEREKEEGGREEGDGSTGVVPDPRSSEASGPRIDGSRDSGNPTDAPSGDDDDGTDDNELSDTPAEYDGSRHGHGRYVGFAGSDATDDGNTGVNSTFARSRWFTRGWTLQELLAPNHAVFFSASWSLIGRKLDSTFSHTFPIIPSTMLNRRIRALPAITGIPKGCLDASSPDFAGASVAQKMSWAAGRKTTRREDRAYSLLGIFGINMPMLYGEGANAFVRLQEEILRLSDDQTLLAWGFRLPPTSYGSNLLARSPDDFAKCGKVVNYASRGAFWPSGLRHYTMTNKGLHIELETTGVLQPSLSVVARLNCRHDPRTMDEIVLPLLSAGHQYYRDDRRVPELCFFDKDWPTKVMDMYIRRNIPGRPNNRRISISCDGFDLAGGITEIYPEIYTSALKEGRSALVSGAGTILFLHQGGGLPRFIAKIMPPFWCSLAWMPFEATSLSSLIMKALSLPKQERDVPWYDALDRLGDLNWQEVLDCPRGTRLSVRIVPESVEEFLVRSRGADSACLVGTHMILSVR